MSLLNFGLPTSFFERRILLSDFLLPVPKDSVEKSRRALFFCSERKRRRAFVRKNIFDVCYLRASAGKLRIRLFRYFSAGM